MTIAEEIISKNIGREVGSKERVFVNLSLVTMRDFGGPNVILGYEREFGDTRPFDPDRIAVTFDLHTPPRNEKVAQNQKLLRDFAAKWGIRVIENGVGQHRLFEEGLVHPSDIIIGTDSHMNLLSAFGCYALGVGTTDIIGALYSGRCWIKVPPTVRIKISGTPGKGTTAKDLILYLLRKLGTDGLLGYAAEFYGLPQSFKSHERITFLSMITELSGDIGFIPEREPKDCVYERELDIDVDGLPPLIACPHSPANVRTVQEVAGERIDQVFIGSCTNGRFEDFQIAANILKGRKVKCRLICVPATRNVLIEMLKSGVYLDLIEAGAVISNPGCSLCTAGHPGILAPGEVMVSTSNRNFIDKLGKGGKVYLASPATAAASALMGVITEPSEVT
ncbi:homoaconitate hydratase family protein [candidate division WOR-3 bacterium]|uniref:Homoaconitate hydratase family protein n=1 Tax=candidate division WOR-3 bacterium TaxID=2052148 RepID=A0A660SG81_UNCW3|nr:MAG: homoaconitate hydratase family protein [candidate division WOR-3 bacterium]